MQKIKAAIAGILSLFLVTEAVAQSAPATLPFHTVWGRLGAQVGDTGPAQAIPFATIASQIFTLAPSIAVVHPSSTNVYGPGCSAASTTFWNVTENLCATGDTWILNSSDPSALFTATIGGSVTVGDQVGLTISTTTGACASGCTASYTAVSGDTLTKVTQGLVCAIANNSNLFNLNGSVCTAGVVNYGPGGVGGYAKGTVVGLLPATSSTTLNFDFNSASGMAVTVAVTGAATETVTIQNTTCSVGCSKGWDVNPTLVFGRLVPGLAPPANSQIFGLVVQGANSATPSAYATQYGVLANTVLTSTAGAVASRWSLLTPNTSGVNNQGIFVGAGLYTPGASDNGVDSISTGTFTAVGTNTPVAGSGWSLLGGSSPGSYCTNWTSGAWLPCSLFGLSWDFKPSNSATSGVSISANLVKPDATNVTALGASANRWSNVFSTSMDLTSSSLVTQITAPSSPAAGRLALWADSTATNVLQTKNSSGTISNTVVADAGAANNFLTAISASGAISKAQPSFSNLSGTMQGPGTATNDNAAAGNVGEYASSTATNTSATVTISNATPGIISWTAHGQNAASPINFTTTGALPTGLVVGTNYYVCSGATLLTDSFAVATSVANALTGTCVATSSAGSGTHTAFSNVVLTSAATTNVTAISLTAGDWEVSGLVNLTGAGTTTVTNVFAGLSGTAAMDATVGRRSQIWSNGNTIFASPTFVTMPLVPSRFSLSSTTTVYLNVLPVFGTSTAGAHGIIRARRAR